MVTLPMVLISGNHYGTLFIGGSREADLLASVTQLEVDKLRFKPQSHFTALHKRPLCLVQLTSPYSREARSIICY